jgi:hypothetical protein
LDDRDSQSNIFWTAINHIYRKDLFRSTETIQDRPGDFIFYLTTDKRIIGNALSNAVATNQVFILNNRGYSFTESFSRQYIKIQKEVGRTELKYNLLNVNNPSDHSKDDTGLLPISYEKKEIDQLPVESEIKLAPDLTEIVDEIFTKRYEAANHANLDTYVILFDDGKMVELPESRHVFLYEEEKDEEDFDKLFKSVEELKAGDQIILPKHGIQLKELLEETLKKDPGFPTQLMLIRNGESL